jgi:hypothetical protein
MVNTENGSVWEQESSNEDKTSWDILYGNHTIYLEEDGNFYNYAHKGKTLVMNSKHLKYFNTNFVNLCSVEISKNDYHNIDEAEWYDVIVNYAANKICKRNYIMT